jgi:signal transduction histidine kinase
LVQENSTFQEDIELISQIDVISNILEVICETTGMGFAAIARVTDESWVACAVLDRINFGLRPGGELDLESTLCHEVKQQKGPVVIDHVAEDQTYCKHHTPLRYGFQSYISLPILLKDGRFFGTLCAIDPKPAKVNNDYTIGLFRLFADLISFHINAIEHLKASQASLLEERKTAELRDQFIAILGHDLRNPVGAILNASQLLLRITDNERVNKLAHLVQGSTYRIKQLIENILDFAKGEMGGGIDLNIVSGNSLEAALDQVISEILVVNPGRVIERELKFKEDFPCDASRIAQLLSNLLANAISHGDTSTAIRVNALAEGGQFTLSVINSGNKIPEEKLQGLFKPFFRGDNKGSKQGLGLGLYIAQEIARAHGGTLVASSTDVETCFTLSLETSTKKKA